MGGKRANPALDIATAEWLNAALMAWRRSVFVAIADPPRLDHVIERKLVGNALGGDTQGARCDHVDLALPEVRRPAAVVDHHRRTLVRNHRSRAIARPVLELCERHDVGETLADGRLSTGHPADF